MTYRKHRKCRMYSKADALMGGPGLDGYASRASVYCVDCGRELIEALEPKSRWNWTNFCDSELVPQPIFFGESDLAQHCERCGKYLYGPPEA